MNLMYYKNDDNLPKAINSIILDRMVLSEFKWCGIFILCLMGIGD